MVLAHLSPQIPILQEVSGLDLSVPQRRLRALVLEQLPAEARGEAHLGLLLEIELVVLGIESLRQVGDVALRVQRLPGPRADAPLAALEREQQRVEARRQLSGVDARDRAGLAV